MLFEPCAHILPNQICTNAHQTHGFKRIVLNLQMLHVRGILCLQIRSKVLGNLRLQTQINDAFHVVLHLRVRLEIVEAGTMQSVSDFKHFKDGLSRLDYLVGDQAAQLHLHC